MTPRYSTFSAVSLDVLMRVLNEHAEIWQPIAFYFANGNHIAVVRMLSKGAHL